MSERTRAAVTEFFTRLATGDRDHTVALFADTVQWDIPGATHIAPWLGPRHTRAEVREFYEQLDKGLIPGRFDVERILTDGPHAVVVGHVRCTIRATGKVFDSDFTIEFEVGDDGLITRYRMLEDSWKLVNAVRP